jgi:hypothetical protein
MANELTFKRLREKVTETMGTQKNLGGAAFVVMRNNGSVLSGKTGTYEFDLEGALEVHEGDKAADYGGNSIMTKNRARVEVIKALGQQAVRIDKTLIKMAALKAEDEANAVLKAKSNRQDEAAAKARSGWR